MFDGRVSFFLGDFVICIDVMRDCWGLFLVLRDLGWPSIPCFLGFGSPAFPSGWVPRAYK